MAAVFEDAIKKDISSAKFARGYMLYGDDAYLKKHYSDLLAEKAVDGDPFFNLQIFGGDCVLQDVYDAVMQFPMMAERKCVFLNDYDFEKADKTDLERLCTLVSELNDTCVFVLRFDSVEVDDKRSSKAKKLITALEKGGGKAVKLNHRTPSELARMLTAGAAKRGCKLDNASAQYLVELSGADLNILRSELDKLCAYVGKGAIDRETIRSVAVKTPEASVYELADKIFAMDMSGALDMLDSLFFLRLEPMIILYTISSAYVDIYRVLAARNAGAGVSDVGTAFGYGKRAFVLNRAADKLRKMDARKLTYSFEVLLDTDRSLKSFGGDPRIILEKLVVRLCAVLSTGERV